ncbi:hypothetical protein MNV49_000819 [Pseudohyphozyma bogoriensis]|nr:hypothetical protein MNV49_000819 [Pseudohyphozyma bogoriensis]
MFTTSRPSLPLDPTLYEYYNVHQHNKALLDILEGFSQNLEVAIERLQVREELLIGKRNAALESIGKDFENAARWLQTNDKNLRSGWTALQAADKLRDLDDRLTKAFSSKMAVALFSAIQDTRHATTQIQSTLDGMAGNLEVAVREASREGLQQAIRELKEEAYAVKGGGGTRGFSNGEAEKIISHLVDQLSAQARIREEEEELALGAAGYDPLIPPPGPYQPLAGPVVPYSSSSSRRTSTAPSSAYSQDDSLFAPQSANGAFSRNGSMTSMGSADSGEGVDGMQRRGGRRKGKAKEGNGVVPGSIVFSPLDPFTNEDLIDPVLANDGLIHDRWTLIESPLLIVGDVVQLREAIFQSYPQRRLVFEEKRQQYREATIRDYEQGPHVTLPSIINQLSHVILWEPMSVSMRIRRGIAKYRIRDLEGALEDLNKAVELSRRGADGTKDEHEPDIDALRARAMVKEELHDNAGALEDITTVLATSPYDVLALSLRAGLRGNSGDLKGAQADLSETNLAITSDKAYRSRIGDSDCDLEYLLRGWAYSSIADFTAAIADFGYSMGLRPTPEPYTFACRALAKVNSGLTTSSKALVKEGFAELDEAITLVRTFADANIADVELGRHSSGAETVKITEDGLPVHAFGNFFLRGMAFFAKQEFKKALSDFDQAMALRPALVKDTGEFRFALGQLRAEAGDRAGASKDFDFAIALKPEERPIYQSTRDAYGL